MLSMTKTILIAIVGILLLSCKNSSPRPPTDTEIKEYLEKEKTEKDAETKAETNRFNFERLESLKDEKMRLQLRIQEKEIQMNQDEKRLFRRIHRDTVLEWVRDVERDKFRISEIDKEIKSLTRKMKF